MSTLFTKIIKGEIPSHKIAENNSFYAFLDIRPIAPGHTLVIPKEEVDHFFDMNDDNLNHILKFAQPIVKAIESAIPCKRVGSMIAGLEVPHAHLHLVPIISMQEFSFAYAKQAQQEDLITIRERILKYL